MICFGVSPVRRINVIITAGVVWGAFRDAHFVEIVDCIMGLKWETAFYCWKRFRSVVESTGTSVPPRTFRISLKCCWKKDQKLSWSISKKLGYRLAQRLDLEVNLRQPDIDLSIRLDKDSIIGI